ncbi:MAG: hypothetical protein WEE64_10530 [Dehalococcoidia bacterium]
MSLLHGPVGSPRRAWLLAALVGVWSIVAVAQFWTNIRGALDLRDTLSSLTPAEQATFWNGPAEPFGRYAASRLPRDATVVLVDMGDPDANIASLYLYPRTMLRGQSDGLGELVADSYLVYFSEAGPGSAVSVAQADVEGLVREQGRLGGVLTYTAPDGSTGVILKVVDWPWT